MLGQGSAQVDGSDLLRLGIVGCGRQTARGHVPAAERARGVVLAGVADTDLTRCSEAAPGVPAFASAQALAAGGVDAIVVSTPTADHVASAGEAAAAGLPSLVEKPPAPSAADATALAALSAPVWIGFNRRFDPELETLRERLRSETGLSLALRLDFPIRLWRPHVPHDDALLDLGTHLVDLARWLLGAEVRRVRATSLTDNQARLELELGDNRAAVECTARGFWREDVTVLSKSGETLASHPRGGITAVALGRLGLRRRDDGFVSSLTRQLEAFAASVRGGDDPRLARVADGVAALAAVEAARASARTNEWAAVQLPAENAA